MRLTFIPAQTIKIEMATRPDLTQFVVGGIYIAPGMSVGRVRLWKVNADLSDGGEIPFETDSGKDDSVALAILPTGDLLVTVGEASPGGGGATTQPAVYLKTDIFPAVPGCVDYPARWQANAATKMAAAAGQGVAALTVRVEALEG